MNIGIDAFPQNLILSVFGFFGYFFVGVIHLHSWSRTGNALADSLADSLTVRRTCVAMGALALVQAVVFLLDALVALMAVNLRGEEEKRKRQQEMKKYPMEYY